MTPKGDNAFWVYDVKTNTWIDPKPKGAPCNGSTSYNTNVAAMHYDSVNDVVVLFRFGGDKEEQGIFVYDPETNIWLDEPKLAVKATGQCKNAFYDPELNVHVIHGAGDSRDDGTVWAYRYKKAKK